MINLNFVKEKKLKKCALTVNGTTSSVLSAYASMGISYKQLLSDFLDIKQYQSSLTKADNPWQYLNRQIKGISAISGCSSLETAFIFSGMKLKSQQPTEVINALIFDNSVRNDSYLENSLLLDLFLEDADPNKPTLIVNPMPYAVETIKNGMSRDFKDFRFSIPNERIAVLYNGQYKCSDFQFTGSLCCDQNIDQILVFYRDTPAEDIHFDLVMKCCSAEGCIDAVIPAEFLGKEKTWFRDTITGEGFHISRVVRIPSALSQSTPRKKLMITLTRSAPAEIVFYDLLYNEKSKEVTAISLPEPPKPHQLMNASYTLTELFQMAAGEYKPQESTTTYSSASLYFFSKEIAISYNVYEDRKKKFSAVAYYASIKDIHNLNRRGKRCTDLVEKGLRGNSTDEVISRMENIVFDSRVYSNVVRDIEANYKSTGIPLSMKTLWFCCFAELTYMKTFEAPLSMDVFSKRESLLAEIIPSSANADELVSALAADLCCSTEEIPFSYLNMINMILNEAARQGFLGFNPLAPHFSEYTTRETIRQHATISAMVYKAFTEKQEADLVHHIVPYEDSSGPYPFVTKSILLTPLLRLFLGIQNREACALTWKNIEKNINGFCAARICHFVDENGKLLSHILNDDWDKYRLIPVCRFLQSALSLRKEYLLSLGISREIIEESPIILQHETISDMMRGIIPKFCKPVAAAAECKRLVKAVRVNEGMIILPDAGKELVVDIYKYHGDIFTSTFRNQLDTTCSMADSDIRYLCGLTPANTLSKHYESMEHPDIQNILYTGIERWTSRYNSLLERIPFAVPKDHLQVHGSHLIGPFKDGLAACTVTLNDCKSFEPDSIEIQVEALHGYEVEIQFYE